MKVSVSEPGRVTASFEAKAGEVIAVVGPNGAGKTSLLRAITGTLGAGPGAGKVSVGEQVWDDLPPHQRSVGLVFQEHLLFPHLDALANVAFGPRARGIGRRQAEATARDWLDRLGVGDLAHRLPDQLSGGQAQRVALARALATDPQVLLLDEPFAALDLAVAANLRDELATHLSSYDGVVLLVSHEPLDVLALASRVIVLEDGQVRQDDTIATVAEAPATSHAARLLGLNVLRGVADGTVVRLEEGELVTATRATGPALATFSPNAITLTRNAPEGSARNRWELTIKRISERDDIARVHLQGAHELFADVTSAAATALGFAVGDRVWASVKATEIAVFAQAPMRPTAGAPQDGREAPPSAR